MTAQEATITLEEKSVDELFTELTEKVKRLTIEQCKDEMDGLKERVKELAKENEGLKSEVSLLKSELEQKDQELSWLRMDSQFKE